MAEQSGEKDSWTVGCSYESTHCINPIRQLVDTGAYVPNPDKEVIKLNIGDPTFFGNLPASPVALQALADAALSGTANSYSPTKGLPLAREAVAKKFSYDINPITAEDLQMTSGCSQALEFSMTGLCDPGDNILLPRPGFSLYKVNGDSRQVDIKYYNLLPEKSWEADLDHMESVIDSKTKAIVIVNPSNPCGSAYSKKHLLEIVAVAEKHRLPIITDEIYHEIVYNGGEFHPLASLTDRVPIITCSGIGKRYLIPGWRLGWMIFYDKYDRLKNVRTCMLHLSTRILGPSSLPQVALPTILSNTPQEFFDKTTQHLATVSKMLYERLSKIVCLQPIKPVGAMYMLVGVKVDMFKDIKDDADFTRLLMAEQSVFCLPGHIFAYANFFRIVLLAPPERMEEAVVRMTEFCNAHMK